MAQFLLLPHLAAACREARDEAGVGAAKVAGEVPYAASTSISRTFENAQSWPGNPDAVVEAYARVTGTPALSLWREAITRAEAADLERRREPGEGDELSTEIRRDLDREERAARDEPGRATG